MRKLKYTKEQLENAVKNSTNIDEVFLNLGLKPNGSGYRWIRGLIEGFDISCSHFYKKGVFRIDLNVNDLSNGFRRNSGTLNKFLNFHGIEKKCCDCQLSEWRGKEIILDVDHINGNPLDNRLENLQYLCPNCHRQKTIANIKEASEKNKILNTKFCECGNKIGKKSTYCKSCSRKNGRAALKISWPEKEYFLNLIWEKSLTEIGKTLGVSDVAIKKHLRKINIPFPTQNSGYWPHYNNKNFEKCQEIRNKIEKTFRLDQK